MPIAAGNLFIGEFDMTNALSKPLEATRFGIPFCYKPARLKVGTSIRPVNGFMKTANTLIVKT